MLGFAWNISVLRGQLYEQLALSIGRLFYRSALQHAYPVLRALTVDGYVYVPHVAL